MQDIINARWYKWDKWYNNGKFDKIVEEFDQLLKNNEIICAGDLVRRDTALEAMGIVSIANYQKKIIIGGKDGKKR